MVFQVHSVIANGITTLIKNSPNSLTCLFGLCKENGYKEKYLNAFSASLGKKFDHRKLFTSGLYLIEQVEGQNFVKAIEWLQNTNLLTLWPPEQLVYSDFYVGFIDHTKFDICKSYMVAI